MVRGAARALFHAGLELLGTLAEVPGLRQAVADTLQSMMTKPLVGVDLAHGWQGEMEGGRLTVVVWRDWLGVSTQ